MGADLSFACDCGAVTGVLKNAKPADGVRLTCYCQDCQAFVFYLGREDDILDDWGGTDLFQTLPTSFEISTGRQNLACVMVTGKGVARWYAACCKTPIANTASSAKLPFLGSFFHIYGSDAREAVIGPSQGHVFAKAAWSRPQSGRARHPMAIMGRPALRAAMATP